MNSQQKNFFIKCLEVSFGFLVCLIGSYYLNKNTNLLILSNRIDYANNLFYSSASAFIPILISFMLRQFNEGPLHREFWLIKVISIFKHALFVLASELILWHIFFDQPVNGFVLTILSIIFSFKLFILNQFIYTLFRIPMFRSNLLILGAGAAGKEFAANFLNSKVANTNLVGFIEDKPHGDLYVIIKDTTMGMVKIPILPSSYNFSEICKQYHITDIVIASDKTRSKDLVNEIYQCRKSGINIHESSKLSEKLYYKVPVLSAEQSNYIFDGELYVESSYDILIRITNVIFATIGLVIYGLTVFPIIIILLVP